MGSTPEIVPATDFETVSPSDSVNLTPAARALYVGTGGDLTIINGRGNAVTFVGVPSGSFLPVQTIRVNATGTAAEDIIALF